MGACFVKDGIVLSTGYNGMPWGCSDDILPWDNTPENEEENKRPYGNDLCGNFYPTPFYK